MFHDDEFNRIFKQMSGSFVNLDDVFEMLKNAGNVSGPVFYGYTMTIGPDGKPVTQEYGNVQPDRLPTIFSVFSFSSTRVSINGSLLFSVGSLFGWTFPYSCVTGLPSGPVVMV